MINLSIYYNLFYDCHVAYCFYSYAIDHEYAARVHDPRTYHNITRDIVTRWVYPLVPDSQVVSKESSYVHLKQYSYREKDVFVARSVHIGDCVVIGKGSRIDENSTIQKTIIGPGCVIQNNVDIIDSHIWEGRNIRWSYSGQELRYSSRMYIVVRSCNWRQCDTGREYPIKYLSPGRTECHCRILIYWMMMSFIYRMTTLTMQVLLASSVSTGEDSFGLLMVTHTDTIITRHIQTDKFSCAQLMWKMNRISAHSLSSKVTASGRIWKC